MLSPSEVIDPDWVADSRRKLYMVPALSRSMTMVWDVSYWIRYVEPSSLSEVLPQDTFEVLGRFVFHITTKECSYEIARMSEILNENSPSFTTRYEPPPPDRRVDVAVGVEVAGGGTESVVTKMLDEVAE